MRLGRRRPGRRGDEGPQAGPAGRVERGRAPERGVGVARAGRGRAAGPGAGKARTAPGEAGLARRGCAGPGRPRPRRARAGTTTRSGRVGEEQRDEERARARRGRRWRRGPARRAARAGRGEHGALGERSRPGRGTRHGRRMRSTIAVVERPGHEVDAHHAAARRLHDLAARRSRPSAQSAPLTSTSGTRARDDLERAWARRRPPRGRRPPGPAAPRPARPRAVSGRPGPLMLPHRARRC